MTTVNTYHKFVPNVFLAKSKDKKEKGEIIELTTRHNKINEHFVHNLVFVRNEYYYYSITRCDGINTQTHAQNKSKKYDTFADNAASRSLDFVLQAEEGKDFLILAEPIKIGHHSEKRHRALIERNHRRMDKAVEEERKVEYHKDKADYWKKRAKTINLSMPESVDYFTFELEEAIKNHQYLKENPNKREHSFSLTYANKHRKDMQKKLDIAIKLWK